MPSANEGLFALCCCCVGITRCLGAMGTDINRGLMRCKNIAYTSSFVLLAALVLFIFAWGVAICGGLWSHTYYDEYYAPLQRALQNGSLPQNATEYIVNGLSVKIPRSQAGVALPEGTIHKYFPMKFSHIIPGLLVTIAHLALLFYSSVSQKELAENYRYNIVESGEDEGFTNDDCAGAIVCCRNVVTVFAVIICCVAWIIVSITLVMTLSFVENTMGNNFHTLIPVISSIVQTFLLCCSLVLGFVAKTLIHYEQRHGYKHPSEEAHVS